jgi:hypothetical protein
MPNGASASRLLILCFVITACSTPPETPEIAAAGMSVEQAGKGLQFPLARTPERLRRGEYLVEAVAQCFHCHSEVDWKATGQPRPGKKGGGTIFPEDGMEWLVAPNISPDRETGAGTWSDEQFVRAIRNGIGHDGRVLFPIMPYPFFRAISDEDLAAIIVYVRSVPPVRNRLPKTVVPQELQMAVSEPPPHVETVPPPDLSTSVKRGAYLATIAECRSCHTPFDPSTGTEVAAFAYAGGGHFSGLWGNVSSRNITVDPSGISYFDEAIFIQAMRTGKVGGVRPLNPLMPWSYFAKMTDEDLRSLFAYLQSVPPVKHHVDNAEPVAQCARCGEVHHGGAENSR